MHVRRDHRTLHRALVALLFLAVLYYDVSSLNTVRVRVSDHPAAGAHDAQRAGIGTKDGRAHVVGEAGEGLGEFAQVSGQRLGVGARVHAARTRVTSTRTVTTTRPVRLRAQLADHALAKLGRRRIQQTEPLRELPTSVEGLAEHLQARANREHRPTRLHRAHQATVGAQVFGGQQLGDVLPATQGVDVQRLRDGLPVADGVDLGGDAAQAGALPQHERVAVVAVGAEHVGEHQANVELCHYRASSSVAVVVASPVVLMTPVPSASTVFAPRRSSSRFRSRKAV